MDSSTSFSGFLCHLDKQMFLSVPYHRWQHPGVGAGHVTRHIKMANTAPPNLRTYRSPNYSFFMIPQS